MYLPIYLSIYPPISLYPSNQSTHFSFYFTRVQVELEDRLKANQREVCECIDKIDALYERLQMDANTKFEFLANNKGLIGEILDASVEEKETEKNNILFFFPYFLSIAGPSYLLSVGLQVN